MAALLRSSELLHALLRQLRAKVARDHAQQSESAAAAAAVGDANGAPTRPAHGPRPPPFNLDRLRNLPHECTATELEHDSSIVLILDRQLGEFRNLQNIQRFVGCRLLNPDFPAQLDMVHEHLLPFANGVLDLDATEFRPGRPSDMVMRGPTYPFLSGWTD